MYLKMAYRLARYVIGVLLVALSIPVGVNAGLGVTPTTATCYALSVATGLTIGTCIMILYTVFLLVQIILMGRAFRMKDLLQLPVSVAFGWVTDLISYILRDVQPQLYPARLGMALLSVAIISAGIYLYFDVDIMPLPVEGLTGAITYRLKKYPFHKVKPFVDVGNVTMAAIVSLVSSGVILGIREGTVIMALFSGRLVGLLHKLFDSKFLLLEQKLGIAPREQSDREELADESCRPGA